MVCVDLAGCLQILCCCSVQATASARLALTFLICMTFQSHWCTVNQKNGTTNTIQSMEQCGHQRISVALLRLQLQEYRITSQKRDCLVFIRLYIPLRICIFTFDIVCTYVYTHCPVQYKIVLVRLVYNRFLSGINHKIVLIWLYNM